MTCERISRVSRFITTQATAIIITTMEVGVVQVMLKLLKQLKLKMLKQQVPNSVLLLVLIATLAGDGALRDAALAGDSDLRHAMFLLTANTAFINVIIA